MCETVAQRGRRVKGEVLALARRQQRDFLTALRPRLDAGSPRRYVQRRGIGR